MSVSVVTVKHHFSLTGSGSEGDLPADEEISLIGTYDAYEAHVYTLTFSNAVMLKVMFQEDVFSGTFAGLEFQPLSPCCADVYHMQDDAFSAWDGRNYYACSSCYRSVELHENGTACLLVNLELLGHEWRPLYQTMDSNQRLMAWLEHLYGASPWEAVVASGEMCAQLERLATLTYSDLKSCEAEVIRG